jgi:phosphatidylserine/phosphatidylglycerophosphate/cardiolipin synthase-like enzyme
MNEALITLADADLAELAKALRSQRLDHPYSISALQRLVDETAVASAAQALQDLANQGFTAGQIGVLIEYLLIARGQRRVAEDLIDLVTSGPEAPGITNRSTSVVVRELFAHAHRSVLVAGYAVYQGQKVFQALSERMASVPELSVKLFLDISRGHRDTSASSEIRRRFVHKFRTKDWPVGGKLPQVYFDPRSLESEPQKRSSLHAKCIVVDGTKVFVSSANFTEAAQERNIEVGLLIESPRLAQKITSHFDMLTQTVCLIPAW